MKNYIFAIIFISSLNLFSIEYDLDVITLPYDSLNIEDIVVSNFTILARSGNTIYKSTDDGTNWKIAFESELKINQLYSKDPHTILLVGEKGMVYRTMDYGETWLDEKVDTDSTLIKVAARNYQDYVVLANKRWLFHKYNLDKEWNWVNFESPVNIYTMECVNNIYSFGGSFYIDRWKYRGKNYYKYIVPSYTFNGSSIVEYPAYNDEGEYEVSPNYISMDSLKYFNVNNSLFMAAKSGKYSYLTSTSHFVLEFGPKYSVKNETVSGVLNNNDTVYAFMKSGRIDRIMREDLDNNNGIIDTYNLNINLINQIYNPYGKVIYLASNNSRIYKMSIYEPVSSIQVETNNLIKQYNDRLWVDNEVEIIGVYNYIGQKLSVKQVSNKFLEFKQGIYYLSYKYKNKLYNHKVMVN